MWVFLKIISPFRYFWFFFFCLVSIPFFPLRVTASEPETRQISNEYTKRRKAMVEDLAVKGIQDSQVLKALSTVPREVFLRPGLRFRAYMDEETKAEKSLFLSRPLDWARVLGSLGIPPEGRVLVIDPGVGYGGALVSQLAQESYVVITRSALFGMIERIYEKLIYGNLSVKAGSLQDGWPESAPFDRIWIPAVVNDSLPPSLFEQLVDGGYLVVGEGREFQNCVRYTKTPKGNQREVLGSCHFPSLS